MLCGCRASRHVQKKKKSHNFLETLHLLELWGCSAGDGLDPYVAPCSWSQTHAVGATGPQQDKARSPRGSQAAGAGLQPPSSPRSSSRVPPIRGFHPGLEPAVLASPAASQQFGEALGEVGGQRGEVKSSVRPAAVPIPGQKCLCDACPHPSSSWEDGFCSSWGNISAFWHFLGWKGRKSQLWQLVVRGSWS